MMTLKERNERIKTCNEIVAKVMLDFLTENHNSGVEFYRAKNKDGVEEIVFRVQKVCDWKETECPHDETLIEDLIPKHFLIDKAWTKSLKEMKDAGRQVDYVDGEADG